MATTYNFLSTNMVPSNSAIPTHATNATTLATTHATQVTQATSHITVVDEGEEEVEERRPTPYERLSRDLSNDNKCMKEITLGKRIGFYRIRGELGTGNFSLVKMGIHALTKEKVAIKILDKTKLDSKTQRLLSREISSMEKLHHPNIIRLYEVVETLAKLHIVMEYACGGELFNKLSTEGRLQEPDAQLLFSQVLAAVEHMHVNNIIHRDLKAENVFYASPKLVKVGDFGFSTYCKHEQTLNTFCGSPPYAAPELFKDENYFGTFVDVWALGIMLYFMVTGVMPFRADTVAKLKKCILEGSYTIPSYVSDSCQFLIRSVLKNVPQDRFTLTEIRRSDWLEGQESPEELLDFNTNPTADITCLAEDEKEARKILQELGITDDLMRQMNTRDSRNSITGTYRIVLHRVQKKHYGVVEGMSSSMGRVNINDRHHMHFIPSIKPQSKFCTIL